VPIPAGNEKGLADIPDNVKKGLEIVPVSSVDELRKQVPAKEPVAIEWTEDDEKGKPAKPKESEEAVITH
jgi:ATP-dependent Lon protease